MKLSIIILNYKTYGLLKNSLKGLLKNPPDFVYEIVLVDAASDNIKLEILLNEVFPHRPANLKIIKTDRNIGYARANNLGIKQAQGEYVLILNPDTVIFEKTLDKLVFFMDKNPQAGMVGPKIINPDHSLQDSCFRFPTLMYPFYRRTFLANTKAGKKWLNNFLLKDQDRSEPFAVDWLLGACLLVRSKAIAEVGLLDERFFLFLEDTDWCLRFWQKDWSVFFSPDSQIVHYPNRASSETNIFKHLYKKTAWIHLVSWLKFYKKNIFFKKNYRSIN